MSALGCPVHVRDEGGRLTNTYAGKQNPDGDTVQMVVVIIVVLFLLVTALRNGVWTAYPQHLVIIVRRLRRQ